MWEQCHSSWLTQKTFPTSFPCDNGNFEVLLRLSFAVLSFSAVLDSDQQITSPACPPSERRADWPDDCQP